MVLSQFFGELQGWRNSYGIYVLLRSFYLFFLLNNKDKIQGYKRLKGYRVGMNQYNTLNDNLFFIDYKFI